MTVRPQSASFLLALLVAAFGIAGPEGPSAMRADVDRVQDEAAPTKTATPAPTAADLAWLAGHWRGPVNRARIDEHWAAPLGGRLMGTSQLAQGSESLHQEFAQIVEDGKGGFVLEMRHGLHAEAAYYRYRSVAIGERSITFENPEYSGDQARRIAYTLFESGSLAIDVVHVAGDKERPRRFSLKRAD